LKKLFLLIFLYTGYALQFAHAAPALQPEVVELLIPKLNSDRIAYFFGNYGVDPVVLNSDSLEEYRISNLYSVQDGQKIMRTLAVVQFQKPVPPDLQQVHREITNGASIGIALRKSGWSLEKIPLYFGAVTLSPQVRAWMQEQESDRAAIHIYKLSVFKEDSQPIDYCTILEVHSPQYLDEAWLEALYPEQYQNFQETSPEVKQLLGTLDSLMQQL